MTTENQLIHYLQASGYSIQHVSGLVFVADGQGKHVFISRPQQTVSEAVSAAYEIVVSKDKAVNDHS